MKLRATWEMWRRWIVQRSLKGTVRVKINGMEADWFKDVGRKTIGLE